MFFIVSLYPKAGTTLMLESINHHPATRDNSYIENYPLGKMLDSIGPIMQDNDALGKILDIKDKGWQEIVKQTVLNMIRKDNEISGLFGTKFSVFSYPNVLNKLFPDAKIIFMRRDPRDSYCSFKAMEQNRGQIPIHCTLWIRKYFFNYRNTSNLKNVLYVDYENLVSNYNQTMSNVWKFLETDNVEIDASKFGDDIFYRFTKQINKKTLTTENGITTHRIGRFEEDLSEGEKYEMQRDISMFIRNNSDLNYGNMPWTKLEVPKDNPLPDGRRENKNA